jgi:putative DNA primase/helicase
MQCPPDYPAIATMIAAGSVVGRRVAIRPKRHDDWTVVANLWGAAIGRPGLMKTPAIQEPLRPLVRLEAEAKLAHEQRLKTHEAEARLASLEKKIREKDVEARLKAGGKPDRDTLVADLMAAGEEQQPPGRQRFIINDSTVEKLGEILRDNPNGVLHFRDELTGWLRSLEREGREGDRAFYLEAWNGSGRFTYDRIGRGTVDIEAACVSLLGGIQPGPLATYLGGVKTGGVADDGLLQRLQLLVWPDTPREWRLVDRRPDSEARERAFAVFKRLADIDPAKIGAQTADERELPFLRFDADAQAEFDTWRHGLEMRLRSGTVHPAFEAHLAKYRSLVPSIALICHLVNGAVGPVSLDACATAIAWAEYLESHAARIYGALLRSGDAAAGELAKHILAGDLGQVFTSREVQRHGWTGLTEREGVAEAIEILVELDWITERTLRTGGRPKTEYVVNPKVMERRP